MVAACSRVIRPWLKRAPMVCTVPASSASAAGRVTPPGTMTPGSHALPARASIMAGRPLSQGGHAQHALAQRQGTDQAAQYDGGVVAVGKAVHHAFGALAAPVAGVAAVGGEGQSALFAESLGGGPDQQADLPVAGVIAQRQGSAVVGAQAALGAENEILRPGDLGRVPAHAGVLRHPEEVAAAGMAQHVFRERQGASRSLAHAAGCRSVVGQDVLQGRDGDRSAHGFPPVVMRGQGWLY